MFVCCQCCVLPGRSLRRVDTSSRVVLPTVVCPCVWSNAITPLHLTMVRWKEVGLGKIHIYIRADVLLACVICSRQVCRQCLFWHPCTQFFVVLVGVKSMCISY
jgi:hypothetical protein